MASKNNNHANEEPVGWVTIKGVHFPKWADGTIGWQNGNEDKNAYVKSRAESDKKYGIHRLKDGSISYQAMDNPKDLPKGLSKEDKAEILSHYHAGSGVATTMTRMENILEETALTTDKRRMPKTLKRDFENEMYYLRSSRDAYLDSEDAKDWMDKKIVSYQERFNRALDHYSRNNNVDVSAMKYKTNILKRKPFVTKDNVQSKSSKDLMAYHDKLSSMPASETDKSVSSEMSVIMSELYKRGYDITRRGEWKIPAKEKPVSKNAKYDTSRSKGTKKKSPSSLEAFKENARQFNDALNEATKQGALEVEFTDITGKTFHRWWNGGSWSDRKIVQDMAKRYSKKSGTFKSSFKKPKDWE